MFEGPAYDQYVRQFLSKARHVDGLDLNKVLLAHAVSCISDPSTSFVESSPASLRRKAIACTQWAVRAIGRPLRSLWAIGKTCISAYTTAAVLDFRVEGNCSVWLVVEPVIRPNLQHEITSMDRYTPSLISWMYRPIRCRKRRWRRVKTFLNLVGCLRSSVYPFSVAVHFARIAVDAMDLKEAFKRIYPQYRPTALLSMKDFNGLENAIVQIARQLGVPTFTTQHAVHHFFSGKNSRAGNLVFTNVAAANILCWGTVTQRIYESHNPDKRCILSCATLRPPVTGARVNSGGATGQVFVFALGGRRHLPENDQLLDLMRSLDENISPAVFYLRPHPTLDVTRYDNAIKAWRFRNPVHIQDTRTTFLYDYPADAICVTGLSGTYYDLLYLGYRTLFYDFGYELLVPLPRVFPPVRTRSDLIAQVQECARLDATEWADKATPVLRETLNLGILEPRRQGLVEEILARVI